MMSLTKKITLGLFAAALLAVFVPALAENVSAQTGNTATTGSVTNLTGRSATLHGSSNFQPDEAWFSFGTTSSMGYSINASNGVGQATGLLPGKTYYYQYVAKKNGIACWGEVKSFTTPPDTTCTAPVATTGSATSVTQNSATLNGSHTGTITRSWFDFGADQNVQYSINSSGGVGQATGLQPGKTYYYRYVVQNDCGTHRGEIRSFTTPSACVAPVATTGSATNVTGNSATINGSHTGTVTRTWFDFGPDQNVQYSINSSNGVGQATGLLPGKTYYFRYVAQNDCGTNRGTIQSFTTPNSCPAPSATTVSATSVGKTSAVLNGSISSSGKQVSYWFEYGTNSGSLTQRTATQTSSGGNVSASISGLSPDTTYYFKLVVQNECGTDSGSVLSFRTDDNIVVCTPRASASTGAASNIGNTSATISGTAGNSSATWFEYGTSVGSMQRINTASGGGSVNLTGLQMNTTYTYRIVAQNNCGTEYGEFRTFTTGNTCPVPAAMTGSATNVGNTSATVSGTATNATAAWIEHGTSINSLQRMNVSAQGGSVNLTGLQMNTTYSYRIVAQNNCGTENGEWRTFTTGNSCPVPAATTGSATNITSSSATVSGTATGATSAWIEYGTSIGNLQRVNIPAQGGSVSLSGLNPNTTYTYRIVAQNNCGTDYGQFLTFTTSNVQCTAPTATLNQATNVGQNSATVSGTVDPRGSTANYYFQYGTDQYNLSQSTSMQTVSGNAQSVSATLTGLNQNTTYYFRLVVQNSCGSNQSQTLYFTTGTTQCTAPMATVNSAVNVTGNSATVAGTVNAQGTTANYYFQYGTDSYNLSQYTPTFTVSGGTQSVSYTITGLNPNTTYYFRLVAQSTCGTNQSQTLSFYTGTNQQCTAPTVSVYAATNLGQNSATLNGFVNSNGSPTTYWFQYGTNYSFGYTSATQGPISGSQNVSLPIYNLSNNTTYYFNIVAQNNCGTAYGQTTLNFVTGGGQPQTQAPVAVTDPATNIGSTSALINGRVNPNGANATAWFEWGPSTALGYVTTAQSIGGGYSYVNLSNPLTGLQPNTTYYFRVVGQNQNGTAQGQILSFTTGSSGVISGGNPPIYTYRPPVIVTTVSGGIAGASCLVLTPAIQPSNPIPGGEFTYSITYRNDCPFDLVNTSLRNYIPNEVDFSATSYPFVTRDLNVITYSLGTVPRGFQNTILVKGLVKPIVPPGQSLVFKSDIAFTDPRGQLQNVSAFLTATVAAVGIATASVFDTLLGFLSSGWFWFLLFLLLLAMFILWLASRRRGHDEDLEHA